MYERMKYIFPSPGLVFSLVLFLYIVFPSFLFLIFPSISIEKQLYYGYDNDIYVYTLFIGAMSIVSFYLGFVFMFKIKTKPFYIVSYFERRFNGVSEKSIFSFSVFLGLIFIAGRLYSNYIGFFHYGGISVHERGVSILSSLINIVSGMTIIFIPMMIFILHKFRLSLFKKTMIMAFLSSVVMIVMVGGASGIIGIFIAFAVYYLYSNKYYVYCSIGNIIKYSVVGLLVVFIAFTIKQITRQFLSFGVNVGILDILYGMGELPNVLGSISVQDIFLRLTNSLLGANALAVITTRISSGNYSLLLGESYTLLIYAFIPRILWSDKPSDIALGMWFTDTYWRNYDDVLAAGFGSQGTGFLFPGELYFNFGLLGVPLGMVLIGCIVGFIFNKLFMSRLTFPGYVFICSVYFNLVHYLYSFAAYLSGFVRTLVLVAVMLLIVLILNNVFKKIYRAII